MSTKNHFCQTTRPVILFSLLVVGLFIVPQRLLAQQPADEVPAIPVDQPASIEPVAAHELNDARILFARLEEQVRIASAKLTPQALERKKTVGRYRSLLSATDARIAVVTAEIQMRDERQRQLRENHLGKTRDASQAARFDKLLQRADEPSKHLRAELELLTRQRGQLQEKLESLEDEHIRCLLEAAVQVDAVEPSAPHPLDEALQEVLGGSP